MRRKPNAKREDFIPAGSIKLTDKNKLGTVYLYTAAGRPGALAFAGNACKPTWWLRFASEESREKRVRDFFSYVGIRQATKILRNQPHTLKVGAIITNSWGYDQTNVDWYAVVRTSAHFVWLRRIAPERWAGEGFSPMAGWCAPQIDVTNPDPSTWGVRFTRDEITQHKAASFEGRNSVHMEFGSGSEWNGKPVYESWYA